MRNTIFDLKIQIGNQAMEHGYDLASILRAAADWIEEFAPEGPLMPDDINLRLIDINGNTVGLARTYSGTWKADNVGHGFGTPVQPERSLRVHPGGKR